MIAENAIPFVITFSLLGMAIGYVMHSYCNSEQTTAIEMLEDDIEQLETRQRELEDRTRAMPHVVAHPVTPQMH